MMSLVSKREVVTVVSQGYRQATRPEKSRILDEFVAVTGDERKYAIAVLNHPPQAHPPRPRLKARRYTPQVKDALVKLWRVADGICAKRLVPALPRLIAALERHDELRLEAETKAL